MKLFIFGSTGDLVKRKVMKALQELGGDFDIFAVGRREMDREDYQKFICSDWCNLNFRKRLNYIQVDFENLSLEENLEKDSVNYFYLSLPPGMVESVLSYLAKIKKKGYSIKILSEKPFGKNLDSSIALKNKIIDFNLEKDFFISDHYLFKKNYLDLPHDFNKMKIVSLERVGLEGRAGYYDSVGAMRDMVQSHFLNLVMKNTDFEFSLDSIKVGEIVRGQYKGYIEELEKQSEIETYVSVNFVCCYKEFEFVTGKAFGIKESFVEIDGNKFIDEGENSYVGLFHGFFSGDYLRFPSMDESILAWRIVKKIEDNFSGDLKKYEKGLKKFKIK